MLALTADPCPLYIHVYHLIMDERLVFWCSDNFGWLEALKVSTHVVVPCVCVCVCMHVCGGLAGHPVAKVLYL